MSDQLDQMYLHTTQLLCVLWREDRRKILPFFFFLTIVLGREFIYVWIANKKCY